MRISTDANEFRYSKFTSSSAQKRNVMREENFPERITQSGVHPPSPNSDLKQRSILLT